MGVKIRQKRNKLYLDIYWQGMRRWEATKLTVTADKAQQKEVMRLAEVLRSKRELQLVSGEWGLLDPVEGKRSLVSYAEELAEGMNPKTHLPKVLRYLREYAGPLQIGAVTEKWLDDFKAWILSRPDLGKTTASHYFAAVCFVFKRAERDRIIPRNPADAVARIPVPEPRKEHLSAEELARLVATPLNGALGYEIYRGFLFACMVGLRISDISSLRWGDIERTPRPQILKRQEKTDHVVGIPINESAWHIIDDSAIHHREELVFPRLSQSRTSPTQYFRLWADQAGVEKKIGWHMARHTFAVLSLEGGADLYTVSKLLGHTDIATTQGYAKATDGMKRKAVDALPEISLQKRKKA
jgi:integrase